MGGIRELTQFQKHFKEYRIVVFSGLNCEDIYLDRQVDSEKGMNLLYDEEERHYHVITNTTGAMAKRYDCKGCNKGCRRDVTHTCQQSCTDCMSVPPFAFSGLRIPCESCNRNFRSQTCFDKHKKNKLRRKALYERQRNCVSCSSFLRGKNTNVSNRTV